MKLAKHLWSECFQLSPSQKTLLCDECHALKLNRGLGFEECSIDKPLPKEYEGQECDWCKGNRRDVAYKAGKLTFIFKDDKGNIVLESNKPKEINWREMRQYTIEERF